MPLAVAHKRSQQIDAPPLIILDDEVDNLFLGVAHHLLAREIGIGLSGTGIKQAEEIINLRGRPHRGARILVGGLLLDGNHRTESRDFVHVRPFQVSQEIAGVGRERLDVSPLPLGKYRVESQRRLPAPAQAGYHRQAVARQFHVHILQVVHPRTKNLYLFCFVIHISSHHSPVPEYPVSTFTSRLILYSLPSAPRAFTTTK